MKQTLFERRQIILNLNRHSIHRQLSVLVQTERRVVFTTAAHINLDILYCVNCVQRRRLHYPTQSNSGQISAAPREANELVCTLHWKLEKDAEKMNVAVKNASVVI